MAKDEEGKFCDIGSRRDFITLPGTPHFDQLVDDFVEIYAFYVETVGVDGLRMELLKQTHRAFWDEFTDRLRKRLGPERSKELILIGNVNDSNTTEIGKYTFRKDVTTNDGATFDTVVNLPFSLAAREYLRPNVGPYGKAKAVEQSWNSFAGRSDGGSKLRTKRGADGLTVRRKLVNQVESADILNRFRVPPISEKQNILANALALFSEGIPCLYYGTEAGITDAKGKVGQPGETGRLTLVPTGLIENFDHIQKTVTYQSLSALSALRAKLVPLRDGVCSPLWSDSATSDTDDGVFGFARYIRASEEDETPADFTVVLINASERPRATSAGANRLKLVSRSGKPLLKEGQKLVRLPVAGLDGASPREQVIDVLWHEGVPQVEFLLAPQTVNVYQVSKQGS